MIICPNCGTENLQGMLYCKACGIALVAIPLGTRQLESSEGRGTTDTLSSDGVLILQIEDDDQPLMVQIRQEVILGRTSDQNDGRSYINLTNYGADERGVSRIHARLLRDEKAVYLKDLESTNGTRLNGELIPASVEKRLRDGDEITLGKLKLFIYFKT